ncbi:MAG: hypothetical protein L0Z53_18715, partial [Acidobacteriales bacterium]|nr:hypothetical protein [Terriglobales bacterium]
LLFDPSSHASQIPDTRFWVIDSGGNGTIQVAVCIPLGKQAIVPTGSLPFNADSVFKYLGLCLTNVQRGATCQKGSHRER